MGSRVPLLSMNKAGKQDRVPDKEDGRVVPHQVPVSLLSVVLDGKSSWVSGSVSRTRLSSHCAEANPHRCPFANTRKNLGLRQQT